MSTYRLAFSQSYRDIEAPLTRCSRMRAWTDESPAYMFILFVIAKNLAPGIDFP